ncbi:MAG: N-acetylmuramoyl-L-alanine amidase [Clostridium sp.]|nr:N-acetylmuramoyl-L-alanine amidase [Clostridium sp.]
MENIKFDLETKRKLLYKRKRRRKLIFRITLISFCILSLSIIYLIKNNFYFTNKVPLTTGKSNNIIICLDPGHGDWDSGAKGKSGIMEKDIVLDIALELGNLLEDNNIKVVYTRTNDSLPWIETANDSLKERILISKTLKADLFISLHCNSSEENPTSKGVETWYKANDDNSKNLANYLQNALVELNYTENRSIKTYENKNDAFAVLELNSNIPVLLELGFLSNIDDEKFLSSKSGKSKIVNALNKAILKYIEDNKSTIYSHQ